MKPNLKVCPGCGSVPWDFANPGKLGKNQPEFCQDCGNKLLPRSELPRDIWKDPYVREALKDGRAASDIAVMSCPTCGQYGYYNEGSSFSCRFCDLTFYVTEESDVIRLDDTVTETNEGYNNETLANP